MGYYDSDQNVQEYVEMAEGYDGRELVAVLTQHLAPGATVLELGMGPGKDLALLAAHFQVTGSDSSRVFVDRYHRMHPDADLLLLDAATMDTDRRFDGIYSNKVLQHLTRAQAKASLRRQARVLNPAGVALHAFWYGDQVEEFSGLRFVYYTEDLLADLVGDEYEVVACQRYTEMEADDSLYVVLRKREDT